MKEILEEMIRQGGIFSLPDDLFILYVYNGLDEIDYLGRIQGNFFRRKSLLFCRKYWKLCVSFVRYYYGYRYNCYTMKEVVYLWLNTLTNYIGDEVCR